MRRSDSAPGFGEEEVENLVEGASSLPADEREAFLRKACGGNAALREEVESLLRAEEEMGEF